MRNIKVYLIGVCRTVYNIIKKDGNPRLARTQLQKNQDLNSCMLTN